MSGLPELKALLAQNNYRSPRQGNMSFEQGQEVGAYSTLFDDTDVQNRQAYDQTTSEEFGSAIGQFAGTFLGEVISTPDYALYGLGVIDSVEEGLFGGLGEFISNAARENFEVHKSTDVDNQAFALNSEFLFDSFAQLGPTAALMVGALGTNALLAKTMAKLGSNSKYLSGVREITENAGKYEELKEKTAKVIDGLEKSKTFQTWSTASMSRTIESAMEASQLQTEVYDKLIGEGKTVEEAKYMANKVATTAYRSNLALVALDAFEYGQLFKRLGKGKGGAFNKGVDGSLLLGAVAAEGLEEVAQGIIGEESKRQVNGETPYDGLSSRLKDYAKDLNIQKAFVQGLFGGAVFQASPPIVRGLGNLSDKLFNKAQKIKDDGLGNAAPSSRSLSSDLFALNELDKEERDIRIKDIIDNASDPATRAGAIKAKEIFDRKDEFDYEEGFSDPISKNIANQKGNENELGKAEAKYDYDNVQKEVQEAAKIIAEENNLDEATVIDSIKSKVKALPINEGLKKAHQSYRDSIKLPDDFEAAKFSVDKKLIKKLDDAGLKFFEATRKRDEFRSNPENTVYQGKVDNLLDSLEKEEREYVEEKITRPENIKSANTFDKLVKDVEAAVEEYRRDNKDVIAEKDKEAKAKANITKTQEEFQQASQAGVDILGNNKPKKEFDVFEDEESEVEDIKSHYTAASGKKVDVIQKDGKWYRAANGKFTSEVKSKAQLKQINDNFNQKGIEQTGDEVEIEIDERVLDLIKQLGKENKAKGNEIITDLANGKITPQEALAKAHEILIGEQEVFTEQSEAKTVVPNKPSVRKDNTMIPTIDVIYTIEDRGFFFTANPGFKGVIYDPYRKMYYSSTLPKGYTVEGQGKNKKKYKVLNKEGSPFFKTADYREGNPEEIIWLRKNAGLLIGQEVKLEPFEYKKGKFGDLVYVEYEGKRYNLGMLPLGSNIKPKQKSDNDLAKLNKPFKTFNDGSGTMVKIKTKTSEKEGIKKTTFKTETTNSKGEPRTQNDKGYNTFEEAVENLDIDLQAEENETFLELIEALKESQGKKTITARVVEIRETTDKSSPFYGLRTATVIIGGEKVELRLKKQTTQRKTQSPGKITDVFNGSPNLSKKYSRSITEYEDATGEEAVLGIVYKNGGLSFGNKQVDPIGIESYDPGTVVLVVKDSKGDTRLHNTRRKKVGEIKDHPIYEEIVKLVDNLAKSTPDDVYDKEGQNISTNRKLREYVAFRDIIFNFGNGKFAIKRFIKENDFKFDNKTYTKEEIIEFLETRIVNIKRQFINGNKGQKSYNKTISDLIEITIDPNTPYVAPAFIVEPSNEIPKNDNLSEKDKGLFEGLGALRLRSGTGEITQKEIDWVKKRLPNLSIEYIKEIFANGKSAWGYYYNGLIKIAENAPSGTLFEEGFHAIWDLSLPQSLKDKLLNSIDIKDVPSSIKENYPESNIAKEEYIQTGARKYHLLREANKSTEGLLKSFGRKIYEFFKNLYIQIKGVKDLKDLYFVLEYNDKPFKLRETSKNLAPRLSTKELYDAFGSSKLAKEKINSFNNLIEAMYVKQLEKILDTEDSESRRFSTKKDLIEYLLDNDILLKYFKDNITEANEQRLQPFVDNYDFLKKQSRNFFKSVLKAEKNLSNFEEDAIRSLDYSHEKITEETVTKEHYQIIQEYVDPKSRLSDIGLALLSTVPVFKNGVPQSDPNFSNIQKYHTPSAMTDIFLEEVKNSFDKKTMIEKMKNSKVAEIRYLVDDNLSFRELDYLFPLAAHHYTNPSDWSDKAKKKNLKVNYYNFERKKVNEAKEKYQLGQFDFLNDKGEMIASKFLKIIEKGRGILGNYTIKDGVMKVTGRGPRPATWNDNEIQIVKDILSEIGIDISEDVPARELNSPNNRGNLLGMLADFYNVGNGFITTQATINSRFFNYLTSYYNMLAKYKSSSYAKMYSGKLGKKWSHALPGYFHMMAHNISEVKRLIEKGTNPFRKAMLAESSILNRPLEYAHRNLYFKEGFKKKKEYKDFTGDDLLSMKLDLFSVGEYVLPPQSDSSQLWSLKVEDVKNRISYTDKLTRLEELAKAEIARTGMGKLDIVNFDNNKDKLIAFSFIKNRENIAFEIQNFIQQETEKVATAVGFDVKEYNRLLAEINELRKFKGNEGKIKANQNKVDELQSKFDSLSDFVAFEMLYKIETLLAFDGDPASFKSNEKNGETFITTDLYKRIKEMSSPGAVMNTAATWGTDTIRENINVGIVKTPDSFSAEEISNMDALNKKLKKEHYTTKEVDALDANSFIDIYTAREYQIGHTEWTNQKEADYQSAINGGKSKNGTRYGVQKTYEYFIDEGGIERQFKKSRLVVTPAMAQNNPFFADILTSMGWKKEDNVWKLPKESRDKRKNNDRELADNEVGLLDEVMMDSAVKKGEPTSINTVEDLKQSITKVPNKYTRKQQETPDKDVDYFSTFGSQIRKLIFGNTNNPELRTQYEQAVKKLIQNNLNELQEEFFTDGVLNKERVISVLNSQLDTSTDQEITNVNDLTNPIFERKLENIITSIVRKKVNNIKRPGPSYYNASGWGQLVDQRDSSGKLIMENGTKSQKRLQIKFNENGDFDYYEVVVPIDKVKFKDYLNADGTIDEDRLYIEEAIRRKKGEPTLTDMVLYRIPTEDKYSMFKVRIAGFLPSDSGAAVLMPTMITKIAGLDFDIDKVFGMDFRLEKTESNEIHNNILKLMMQELADPSHFEAMFTPGGFDKLKDYVQEKTKDREYKYNREFASPMADIEALDNIRTGQSNIGQAANFNAWLPLLENNPITLKVPFVINEKTYDTIGDNIRLGSSNIATILAQAVDNIKEPIAHFLNLNNFTLKFALPLLAFNVPLNTVLDITTSDIVKKLQKEIEIVGGLNQYKIINNINAGNNVTNLDIKKANLEGENFYLDNKNIITELVRFLDLGDAINKEIKKVKISDDGPISFITDAILKKRMLESDPLRSTSDYKLFKDSDSYYPDYMAVSNTSLDVVKDITEQIGLPYYSEAYLALLDIIPTKLEASELSTVFRHFSAFNIKEQVKGDYNTVEEMYVDILSNIKQYIKDAREELSKTEGFTDLNKIIFRYEQGIYFPNLPDIRQLDMDTFQDIKFTMEDLASKSNIVEKIFQYGFIQNGTSFNAKSLNSITPPSFFNYEIKDINPDKAMEFYHTLVQNKHQRKVVAFTRLPMNANGEIMYTGKGDLMYLRDKHDRLFKKGRQLTETEYVYNLQADRGVNTQFQSVLDLTNSVENVVTQAEKAYIEKYGQSQAEIDYSKAPDRGAGLDTFKPGQDLQATPEVLDTTNDQAAFYEQAQSGVNIFNTTPAKTTETPNTKLASEAELFEQTGEVYLEGYVDEHGNFIQDNQC